jgi:predicted nucleic acid-binding protein
MAVKVDDASALAALLFAEPEAEAVADQLEGSSLFAPTLLGYEIASVCLKKLRRDPMRQQCTIGGFRPITLVCRSSLSMSTMRLRFGSLRQLV